MITLLVDVNVLIYAVDTDARHHAAANGWLLTALSGTDSVLFPLLTLIGFERLTTSRSAMSNPISVDVATDYVERWLGAPNARIPQPDSRHFARVQRLLNETGTGGNLVNDAHLAALAQQYDVDVISFDNDFSRFPGVRWTKPS